MTRNRGAALTWGVLTFALLAGGGAAFLMGEECCQKKAAPAAAGAVAAKGEGCCKAAPGGAAVAGQAKGPGAAAAVAEKGEGKACCAEGKAAAIALAAAPAAAEGGKVEDCCADGGCPLLTLDVAKMSKCAEDVKITAEQKEKFLKLLDGAMEKCAAGAKKSDEAQRALVLAVLKGESDDDVQARIDAALNLQAKAYETRVRFLKSFVGLLTPEQTKALMGCASAKQEGGDACCESKKSVGLVSAVEVAKPAETAKPAAGMITYKCPCNGKTWTQVKADKKFCPWCKDAMPECGTVVAEGPADPK